jgi:hypothetical protein
MEKTKPNKNPEAEGKGKNKVHPRRGHEGPEKEQRSSSTLSLTSALDGVGG